MNDERQYCTFFLGDLYLGVEVVKVQEVLRYQEMTHVPLAPGAVRGLINLRGQIVTALDMRTRLGLPPRAADQQPMNVVIRDDDGAISLLVDEIGDVVEVDGARFERPPETVNGMASGLLQGVYKLEGQLLLILDVEKAASLDRAAA